MSAILDRLRGVLCHIDDMLIFGKDQKEHNERLNAALEQIQKCEFSKKQITFLGHVIRENGISADPQKTVAITAMTTPTNISELGRFMGMVNQLGKFSQQIAALSKAEMATPCVLAIQPQGHYQDFGGRLIARSWFFAAPEDNSGMASSCLRVQISDGHQDSICTN